MGSVENGTSVGSSVEDDESSVTSEAVRLSASVHGIVRDASGNRCDSEELVSDETESDSVESVAEIVDEGIFVVAISVVSELIGVEMVDCSGICVTIPQRGQRIH